MAKRRSYRAYPAGSLARKVSDNLRHAVSELRHGRKGCVHARDFIRRAASEVDAALFGPMVRGNWQAQDRKVERVVKQFQKKCRGVKL